MTEAMARPWIVRFPDLDVTEVEPRAEVPEVGDELISGWVVTSTAPLESERHDLEVWVAAKASRRTVRQSTDRRD
jgi:hypothetical protein